MIQTLIDFIMEYGTDVSIRTYMENGQALATVVLTLHELGGPRSYTATGICWGIDKLIRTAFELQKTANPIFANINLPIKLEVI